MENITSPNPLIEYAYQINQPCNFAALRLEHFVEALDHLLDEAKKVVEYCDSLEFTNATNAIETCILPIELATERLSKVWNILSHLSAVRDGEALRQLFELYQSQISQFWNELPQDHLYQLHQKIQQAEDFQTLSLARQAATKLAIKESRLGGVDLSRENRQRFLSIKDQQIQLETQFSNNVMDSSMEWTFQVEDPSDVRGIPLGTLDEARLLAEESSVDGWLFTLDPLCARQVIQYAENRFLRARFYQEYHVRASDMFKKPEYDNSQTMENILRLRLEEANLLGFETYAHLATSSRMLSTPKMVFSFLTDLAQEIRPKANQEWKELIEFAHDMGHKSMHPYDVSFFSEKLREHRFSYNEDDVRKYFPLVKVFKGLFDLLHHLFQLRFVPLKTSGWAPGVVAYEVYRQNQLKGVLYFDLYARPHKQNGAWMQEIQNRIDIGKETQLPIAYLTCNFPPPKGANSRCLSHEDIQTLLHEMGHGLHQLLTDISIPSVGGMSGMEWDAVELPSQFLESFAWRYEVLELMSSHIETQASLPKELFEKIRAAGHFQSNIKTLRQVALSLTDLWIHTDQIKTVGPYFLEWLQQVWVEANEYNVLPMSGLTRPLHSFLHIFSGGYAAGYYSYIWADLLASDVYAAFPKGPLEKSARIGNLLIDEFLSKGSVRPAITSFIAFRGREPVIEFLLHKWEI